MVAAATGVAGVPVASAAAVGAAVAASVGAAPVAVGLSAGAVAVAWATIVAGAVAVGAAAMVVAVGGAAVGDGAGSGPANGLHAVSRHKMSRKSRVRRRIAGSCLRVPGCTRHVSL